MSLAEFDDPQMMACVALVRRTGAKAFQLRYSDDEEPVVWMAVALHEVDGETVGTADGALTPGGAAFKLCESLIDGGVCENCGRRTGVTCDFEAMPLDRVLCWWQYDPELREFRRGCAGD